VQIQGGGTWKRKDARSLGSSHSADSGEGIFDRRWFNRFHSRRDAEGRFGPGPLEWVRRELSVEVTASSMLDWGWVTRHTRRKPCKMVC
jgi:hypothetical protein